MTLISFTLTPPVRFDNLPWTQALIQESTTESGSYITVDTITFDTPDTDPANPAIQEFTSDTATSGRWYRVRFQDADSNQSDPTASILLGGSFAYADVAELARILKIRDPSGDQLTALQRVLDTAAGEITSEIGSTTLSGWQQQLAAQVNLDRAADLWRHTETIPGVTGLLGDETAAVLPGRYSWNRYAERLAPIKQSWGLA